MKSYGLLILIVSMLVLAACASPSAPASPTAAPAQPTPYPQAATEPYPLPTNPPVQPQAYPAATVETGILYPDLADGSQVGWIQASGLILNHEVTKVTQGQDKKIYLTLKDGRTVFTTEAELAQVEQTITECGEPCSTIEVAKE